MSLTDGAYPRPEDRGIAPVQPVTPLLDDRPVFTTTVLQMEVVHYLHRKLSNPAQLLEQFFALDGVTVAELTEDDINEATVVLQSYPHAGIGGRDATVLAAMQRYNVSRLWTHDSGLKRIGDKAEWLEIIDPVE